MSARASRRCSIALRDEVFEGEETFDVDEARDP